MLRGRYLLDEGVARAGAASPLGVAAGAEVFARAALALAGALAVPGASGVEALGRAAGTTMRVSAAAAGVLVRAGSGPRAGSAAV